MNRTPAAQDRAHHPPLSPLSTGLAGRCPRCGEGRLFSGFLALAPRCGRCGLDYDFADAGDGPAVFIMTIVGFIVVGAALVVELRYEPPFWVHLLLWLPLITLLSLGMLRPLKGLMIAQQYARQAAEGRLVEKGRGTTDEG